MTAKRSPKGAMGWTFVMALAIAGCGDDGATTGDAGPAICEDVLDCTDGVFCNGVERCDPGAPGADSRGCLPAGSPCEAAQTCDESTARCVTECAVTEDADGDGVVAVECGGTDCDDSDAERFPGNTEVCDAEGHDEDCDPSTLGGLDEDDDGAVSASCCNGDRCGTDCDDADESVRPGQTELCNGADVDCDGVVDEGVTRLFFPDLDGDGYGDRSGEPVRRCALEDGLAENALDCDDSRAESAPGRSEICDGTVDEDCDGTVDEMLAVSVDCQSRFGSPPLTAFTCTEAGECAVGTCGTGLGNCDGELSNGCETDLRTSAAHCGTCGRDCGAGGVCLAGVCDRVVDVEAGTNFTCARRERPDGTPTGVVCWGSNEFGQLGDGTTVDRLTPVRVAGLTDATMLALSSFEDRTSSPFACALASGVVQCWGSNDKGQLGRGAVGSVGLTPAPVFGTPKVVAYYSEPFRGTHAALSVGLEHACVLEDTGVPTSGGSPPSHPFELRCWGGNTNQQIAADTTYPREPFPVATTIATAYRTPPPPPLALAGETASCLVVRQSEYTLRCQRSGAMVSETLTEAPTGLAASYAGPLVLVDGTLSAMGSAATLTMDDGSALPPVAQVVGSNHQVCARFEDGTVACMTRSTRVFTPVSGVSDAVDISTGPYHACVVRSSGGVWCWGNNGFGQCGTGDTTAVTVPTRVVGL